MDDPQRKPGDGDRSALVARIRSAADQGRISAADRDIRLANVASAQTMSELDLMGRDLDQLETSLAVTAASVPPATGPMDAELADRLTEKAVDMAKGTARSFGWVSVVFVVLVLVGLGSTALVALRPSGDSPSPQGELFSPEPIPTDAISPSDRGGQSAGPSNRSHESDTEYALTVIGIRAFLTAYEARFHSTKVVELTLYGDYAVVDVPQAKNRHAGFLYRGGDWQDFGGVTANFPGAQVVDLRRLDVAALAHNIVRARRTLGVEKPTTTYAIVRFYSSSDAAPSVDVHVANKFGESGYLATTLDGTVERAYPYSDVQ